MQLIIVLIRANLSHPCSSPDRLNFYKSKICEVSHRGRLCAIWVGPGCPYELPRILSFFSVFFSAFRCLIKRGKGTGQNWPLLRKMPNFCGPDQNLPLTFFRNSHDFFLIFPRLFLIWIPSNISFVQANEPQSYIRTFNNSRDLPKNLNRLFKFTTFFYRTDMSGLESDLQLGSGQFR